MNQLKLSPPNSKTKIVSFNINNTICKKIKGCKEQGCLKHCYYNKFKRLYPAQTPFLNNNLRASRRKDFVEEISKLIKKQNIKYFRIHTCGEFYSQEYFDKWVKICKTFPDIIFYTYTKNVDIKVKRPKNFTLYISDDKGIWKTKYKQFDGVSKMKLKQDPLPKKFVQCLNQTKGLTCIECKYCMKKGNVCFNKH